MGRWEKRRGRAARNTRLRNGRSRDARARSRGGNQRGRHARLGARARLAAAGHACRLWHRDLLRRIGEDRGSGSKRPCAGRSPRDPPSRARRGRGVFGRLRPHRARDRASCRDPAASAGARRKCGARAAPARHDARVARTSALHRRRARTRSALRGGRGRSDRAPLSRRPRVRGTRHSPRRAR